MVQVTVFIPVDHKEIVKTAMFEAGAGKVGNYDSCCFEHQGVGQFRPLKGSDAFIGKIGELEKVDEVKVEMICEDHLVDHVIKAMKQSHPYETPAYYVVKITL
jgi:hypothetical protein